MRDEVMKQVIKEVRNAGGYVPEEVNAKDGKQNNMV